MQKFGRYQVVKWLGGGGMADVYLAQDPRLGRQVAIKVIRARLPKRQEPEFRRRFYREAQVMARLSHRAIVPIHDFGEEDGRPFIVMRLMEGGSLSELLQDKGSFSLAEAVSLLERLAPALDLAHQQDLVHRDLKPDNILLDRDQTPYIADFGIVKLLDATMPSKTGSIGTPKYMSPEQALGEKNLDQRTDIYALGVILFELLTGQIPYNAPHPLGIAMKHVNEPIPNICDVNPKLPAACQPVMERVLAKKPADRYATVTAFTEALKQLLAPAKKQPANPVNPPNPVELFMRGLEFYKQGAYEQAIAYYRQALRQDVAYVQAYFSRGLAYYQLAEYALAITDYDHVLRLQPQHTAAYYWRGRAKRQINQLEPAIDDFNHALRLNPNYTAAYFQRGQAQQAAGRLELAIRDYDAALRLNPKYTQVQSARDEAQKEQEARLREEERKREEARKREEERKREAERKRKQEEARQREAERKRKETEARQREAERKRKQEEARKREAERKRKEEEARKREAERKRKEAEARQREVERKRKEAQARQLAKPPQRQEEARLQALLNNEAALNRLPKAQRIKTYVSLFRNEALQQAIPAQQRAAIGVELAKLGDPRPEVMTIDGMEFCYVPPGPFWMGSNQGNSNHKPLHKVEIPYGYWIGRYPVTNAQYQAFMNDGGYRNPAFWAEAQAAGIWKTGQVKRRWDDKPRAEPAYWRSSPYNLSNHPVVGVMWYEALAFTRWLSQQTGGPARLPSEAEWEKAARGGLEIPVTPLIRPASQLSSALSSISLTNNPLPQRGYPWGETFDANFSNSAESAIGKPNAVGLYGMGKSPYGAEEMSGNVWEWSQSQYKSYPYRSDDGRETLQWDLTGYNTVLRGGAYYANVMRILLFSRDRDLPNGRDYSLGFRVFRPYHPALRAGGGAFGWVNGGRGEGLLGVRLKALSEVFSHREASHCFVRPTWVRFV